MGAYEIIVGKEHPELLPLAGHIMKAFYDEDILDEEVILEWGAKVCVCLCVCACVRVHLCIHVYVCVPYKWYGLQLQTAGFNSNL